MKFTKLSLAALVAMGIASSASAIENVKVDGDVKLWYQTLDQKADHETTAQANDGLFKKNGASGDLAATLRVTGDLTKRAGFGLTMNALTTLGLENHVVDAEAGGQATSANLNGTDANPMWFSEMYMTYKVGKTIAKLGRQELGTPLCYTETWGAAKNTFEAAVLVNQDIPDTTLVAAMVSRGNGNIVNQNGGGNSADFVGFFNAGAVTASGLGTSANGNSTSNGAFAIGMVNKSVPNLTIHPVYYDVTRVGKAYWIDLTYDAKVVKVEGLYTSIEADKGTWFDGINAGTINAAAAGIDKTTNAYAVRVSGKIADVVTLGGAYSSVDKGLLNVWNFATYASGTPTSKIYTAGVGGTATGAIAGMSDTTGWKIDASAKVVGLDLGAYYNTFTVKGNGVTGAKETKPSSYALTVGGKVDEIDLSLAYINESKIDALVNSTSLHAVRATDDNTKQQVVRLTASLKF